MRTMTRAAAIALWVLAGVAAGGEQKAEKPVVSCDAIVKFYKDSHSVDETSGALKVDQSRVAECLKAAGIQPANEDDE